MGETDSDDAPRARPRGRPQHLPRDPTPHPGAGIDVPSRVAWLLATTRLIASDEGPVPRAALIEALRAAGQRADSSRISRLESGSAVPNAEVIAVYERLGGVEPGALAAPIALLRRSPASREGPPTPAPEQLPHGSDLDALLEAALAGRADGPMWQHLAHTLHSFDRVYLPAPTWSALVERLLSEIARSNGVDRIRRAEACAVLAESPVSVRRLADLVHRLAAAPDRPAIWPLLFTLRRADEALARSTSVDLLGDPSRPRRVEAAVCLSACLADDPAASDHRAVLGAFLRRDLEDHPAEEATAAQLELGVHLTPGDFGRVMAVARTERMRRQLLHSRTTLEMVPTGQARQQTEAVASRAEALVDRTPHEPDPMVRRLLREALFHAWSLRRYLAASALAASPYASAVSRSLMEEARLEHSGALVSAQRWQLVRRLARLTRDEIVAAVLAETRPTARPAALLALGYAAGPVTDERSWEEVVGLTAARHDQTTRVAAVAVLGLAGRNADLETLVASAGPEADTAAWWLQHGGLVEDNRTSR